MTGLFAHLRVADSLPPAVEGPSDWWAGQLARGGRWGNSIELAAAGGFEADRLGWAFASGYHAALRCLLPDLPAGVATAFCATEVGGNRPRHILTTLGRDSDGTLRLRGAKRFVTLGTWAERLAVIASSGKSVDDRNRLALVLIDAHRAGVSLEPLPRLPFVPEVPHAALRLDCRIEPDEVLPGDAYVRYLKPFRTIEDLHVHAAFVGWFLQLCRRGEWGDPVFERGLLLLAASRDLVSRDPLSRSVHLALGGLIEATRELLDSTAVGWGDLPPVDRERWERDRPLLEIAGSARAARLQRTRQATGK